MEYERMLNKEIEPSIPEIENFVGAATVKRIQQFENYLITDYDLKKELKFPFGNNYGWGYKYSDKNIHLCYLFFEKNAFTIMLQLGDKSVPSVEATISSFSKKAQDLWQNRYPCGEQGGWLHYRVITDSDVSEIYKFVKMKRKPKGKVC